MSGTDTSQLIRALTKSLERATEPALRGRLAAAIKQLQQRKSSEVKRSNGLMELNGMESLRRNTRGNAESTERSETLRSLPACSCEITGVAGRSTGKFAAWSWVLRSPRLLAASLLVENGHSREAHDLLGDLYVYEALAAAEMIEEEEKLFEKLLTICGQHKVKKSEKMLSVVTRAAKAGDAEAVSLLASGFLESPSIRDGARRHFGEGEQSILT